MLVMHTGSAIDHLNVIKGLDRVEMGEMSSIGRLNWVTGHPTGDRRHFTHCMLRKAELLIGEHAAITHRHLIDCTDQVRIGRYATFAGFRSQILTHSVNLETCRQDAKPVNIGDFSFVGTGCIVLGGAVLPAYCVLGAGSLLKSEYVETHRVYGGVPAREIQVMRTDLAYFVRERGYVD
jgi:acetyltransferase-like isoleucine patch superfamily enzyme